MSKEQIVKGLIEKRNEINKLLLTTSNAKEVAYLKQAKAGCEYKINSYLR